MNDMNEGKNEPAPDTAPAAASSPADERELNALRNERDQLQGQLQRNMADLANIRRRHGKEMEQARQVAVEGLAAELLPVLDNFHLALVAHEQHAASGEGRTEAHALVQGVQMVRSLLEGALERHGLREIPGHGEPFDPNLHEAVGLDSAANVKAGHIARVLQRGYFLGDRVLRTSRVLVRDQSTGSPQTDAKETKPASGAGAD